MTGVVGFWYKGFLLSVVFIALGFMFTALFVDSFWLRLLGGMGQIILILVTFFLGGVASLHGLDGARIVPVGDGKGRIIIKLCFGPFTYKRIIPGVEKGEPANED